MSVYSFQEVGFSIAKAVPQRVERPRYQDGGPERLPASCLNDRCRARVSRPPASQPYRARM